MHQHLMYKSYSAQNSVDAQRGLGLYRYLTHLRSLNLSGGNFSDNGMRMLTRLTALRTLTLKRCDKITDEGFRALIIPLSHQSLAKVEVDDRYYATPLSSVCPIQTQIKSQVLQPCPIV